MAAEAAHENLAARFCFSSQDHASDGLSLKYNLKVSKSCGKLEQYPLSSMTKKDMFEIILDGATVISVDMQTAS
jgi:hypothetical protein